MFALTCALLDVKSVLPRSIQIARHIYGLHTAYACATNTHQVANSTRFREFYTREKGKKKKKRSTASRGRSTEEKERLGKTLPGLCPLPLVPFDFSFSFPRSLIYLCPPVPLRARISLSSWYNLISLGTRKHTFVLRTNRSINLPQKASC